MNIINSFTKVISAIIACAIVLMVIIPHGIGLEFISADEIPDSYEFPKDIYINGENIAKKPIILSGAGTYNIILEDFYFDLSETEISTIYIKDNINVNLTLIGENT
ncbi:MAG TPA: hypothetical protein GX710_05345, partial [Clostridiales bacterium]|nr:hypothetical protein [Clostridiales bacterium]